MDFRGNNICDAGVTPDMDASGHADIHLTGALITSYPALDGTSVRRRIDPLVAFCLSSIYVASEPGSELCVYRDGCLYGVSVSLQ